VVKAAELAWTDALLAQFHAKWRVQDQNITKRLNRRFSLSGRSCVDPRIPEGLGSPRAIRIVRCRFGFHFEIGSSSRGKCHCESNQQWGQ
jgi:hypothetical protein